MCGVNKQHEQPMRDTGRRPVKEKCREGFSEGRMESRCEGRSEESTLWPKGTAAEKALRQESVEARGWQTADWVFMYYEWCVHRH